MRRIFLLATSSMFLFPLYAAHAAPVCENAWQLHHPDWARMEQTIRRAPEFGVAGIELSHEIITTVDQIADDAKTWDLVQKTTFRSD